MNPITRALLHFAVAAMALAPALAADTENGRWLERGAPLSEFPACYQLWICVPEQTEPTKDTEPTEAADRLVGLPRGTWGTCENMMLGEQAGCGQCNAPEPDEECRIRTPVLTGDPHDPD